MTQPQKKRPGIVTAACIIAWFQAACCLVLGPVGPIDGVAAPHTGYGYEYGSVTLGPLDLIASVPVVAALCTGAVALMARQGWGRVILAVAEALLILDAIWAFALVAFGSVAPTTKDRNRRKAPSDTREDVRAWLDAGAVALGVGSDLVGDSMKTVDYDAVRTSARVAGHRRRR